MGRPNAEEAGASLEPMTAAIVLAGDGDGRDGDDDDHDDDDEDDDEAADG